MAQSHMSFLKNLQLYNNGKNKFKPPSSPKGSLPKLDIHPAAIDKDSDEEEMMDVDEDMNVKLPNLFLRKNYIKVVGKELS